MSNSSDLSKDAKVVLFGAGDNGKLILKQLMSDGIMPAYFVDSNYLKLGDGVVVHDPNFLLQEDKSNLKIIITPIDSIMYAEIELQLKKMGLKECIWEPKLLCPACHNRVMKYLPYGVPQRTNAQCPYCGAVERHRAIWLYFENCTDIMSNARKSKYNILHFAPEKVFYDKFKNMINCDYYPVDADYTMKNIRDVVDIQELFYEDNFFDVIICIHVLEHIPDDNRALKQLLRVLANNGVAYIDVPIYNTEKTFEDSSYNTPELRLKYYGQEDHVRKYGKDFFEKLKRAGFNVEVIELNQNFSDEELYRYGLQRNMYLYKCYA